MSFDTGRWLTFQLYLPQAYTETDADPTALSLFFHRIAAKIDLLSSVIGSMHNIPASLARVDSSNKRFAGVMCRCAPDEWVELGVKMLPEVQGVEGRVDGWMSMLKEERFSELECATELAK